MKQTARWALLLLAAGALLSCRSRAHVPVLDVRAVLATEPVSADPDDPAIWVHPSDPSLSLILGTNKVAALAGALVVYGLDGKTRQTIGRLDRPNNVDVEYGLPLAGGHADIAVVTERLKRCLRVFRIDPGSRLLEDAGVVPVLEERRGEGAAPMGIALYKRPRDGAVFAIVSPKTGPRNGYLVEYRLEDDGRGRVKGVKVREFGVFSGKGEIEAVAVDDQLGYVYYADEGDGIHKWHADPDHPQARNEVAHFGRTEFQADREGIAIYARPDGTGYILCTDQLAGNSHYRIYRREDAAFVASIRGGADSTDGLDATSSPLGTAFPHGFVVAMNSRGRNFLVYRWDDIAALLRPH